MKAPALDSWLSARRLKTPSKTALVFDGESLTYRDLADRADAISRILAGRGIGRGDRVAYIGENSPEFLAALFGTVRLGAVFVPLNTRLAPPEIEYAVQDCGARVAIGDPEFLERLAATGAEVISTKELATGGDAELALDAVAELDDAAAIIYTSGTTGRPKGAILTHGNLTWAALNCIVDFDVISRDVALMISPMFHVAALGMGALPVILKGGTMVLEKKFEPGRALELIAEHKVSMLAGVPTTFQLMCDHPDWDVTDLSSMRILTCGGSAVPTRVLNAYEDRGLGFSQGYGMTETSPGATTLAGDFTRVKQGSVGVPHFFTRVRVVREDGAVAEVGEVGEIEVFGPNVFAGYFGLAEVTEESFSQDGWFRSGDLGSFDEDGFLSISDRLKDMIISGGENVYPAEIENVISDIDGVTGVAVIGVPDERWGEVPWAVVTLREGAAVDTATVRAALDGKLARYKIPAETVVIDELPRTASGKVRKADLRRRFAAA